MHQEIVYDQDGSINTYDGYSIRVSSQKMLMEKNLY